MKTYQLYFFAAFLIFFISCSTVPKDVKINLKLSGNNMDNLQKLIRHYENDEEKLQAAYFLIANMDSRQTLQGDFTKYHQVYYLLDSLKNKNIDISIIKDSLDKTLSSIEQKYGSIESQERRYIPDLQYIDSDYLIKNIDLAFETWKTKPWCKNINFNTFCNFILPYRIHDEPLCEFREFFIQELAWLEDSLKNKNDLNEACFLVNNYLYKKFSFIEKLGRIPFPSAIDMYNFGAGDCEQRYFLFVSAMRSVGIPVSIDFSFQWNHWPGHHSWVCLIDNDHIMPFNAGEYYESFPKEIVIPIGLQTSSTVYRNYFEKQKDLPVFTEESIYCVPQNLREMFIKNVTSQYKYAMTPLDIEIDEKHKKDQTLYLGCFGYGEEIVAIDYLKQGQDKFENIGKCGIYIPFYFKNNKMEYASNPFILSCDGYEKWYSNPLMDQMEDIVITRKFDIQDSMRVFGNDMVGAYFEMSDDLSFVNSEKVFTIEKAPTDFVEVEINPSKPYRYIRYVSKDKRINMAEIEYYQDTIKLKGKAFSNSTSPEESLFDKNIRTNYIAKSGTWVGLDIGSPRKISKIRYLPRNNFNIVEVGDVYELLYFDYEWKSLGIKKAKSNKLEFKAPKYALLLLKDLSKGREERIFKYENNMQIFW